MPEVPGRGIRTKWKTQGDHRPWPRRVESWAAFDPDLDSPLPSWRGGLCERSGPSLYRGSHRIEEKDFSPKEKDPLGHFGDFPCSNSSSLLSTRPLASPGSVHIDGDCMHLISEGAESTGTTQGRVPNNRECSYPPGSACTSSRRELKLKAPPGPGCPATGSVPTYLRGPAPHLGGS